MSDRVDLLTCCAFKFDRDALCRQAVSRYLSSRPTQTDNHYVNSIGHMNTNNGFEL